MALKKKKYPKQPKKSASLAVWERYKTRCAEVDKYNQGIQSDATKKANVIKAVVSMKNKRK